VKAAGGELVAISPQTARHSREFAAEKGLRFPVLHDPGNAVAESYGLTWTLPEAMREMYRGWNIDLAEYNGDVSWVLPIPGRFIVDGEGFIRYAEADPDYMTRPEPADTLEALRSLRRRAAGDS
jgi:peroxiredoxin